MAGVQVCSAPVFEHQQTGHFKDTEGLNLQCDTGFPLGSHKQRLQRP